MFDKGFMVVDILGMFNTNTGCNSESYYIIIFSSLCEQSYFFYIVVEY